MASSRALGCDRAGYGTLMGRNGILLLAATVYWAGPALGAETGAISSEAQRLVAAASQVEVSGDSSRSFALLHEAIRVDPNNELPRWQLGQLQIDGEWQSVEEAQRRAAADPRQAQYRERRTTLGDSPQGQLALARWCRKNNLNDEAQFHWASVVAVDPTNAEALHALDWRLQNGKLVSREQTAQRKEQLRQVKQATERWAPKMVKWRRSLSGQDGAARDEALEEIASITESDAIPTIEEVTLGRDARDPHHADECRQIGLAFLKTLDSIPGQAATESFVRHAVLAADNGVRVSAIEKLKPRDQHDYVPLLMGGLSMPIESTFSVQADSSGNVHYSHTLYREGANSDWAADANYFTMQSVLPGRDLVYHRKYKYYEDRGPTPAPLAKMASTAHSSQLRYGTAAAATESRVNKANQTSEQLNARIIPVLSATTGKDFGTAKQWWDWWRDNNEYYGYDHPVDYRYYSGTDSHTYGHMGDNVTSIPSCFVKGTPVWTKTGQRPIESLEMGDLVLAQDVKTGELKYEPIVGRTVRPPSPILKISLKSDDLRTTRGHLFWVAGIGWRMAKELGDGAKLHGLSGSSGICSIAADGESEAYNLVVADFNTYFVGDSGILVHDNTPRRPTQATVPGILRK